ERGDELREAPARDARAEAAERLFGPASATAADLENFGGGRKDARQRFGAERVVDRVEDVRVREVPDPERQAHRREEDLLSRFCSAEELRRLGGEERNDLGADRGIGLGGGELGGEGFDRFRLRSGQGYGGFS